MTFDARSLGKTTVDDGHRVVVHHERLTGADFSARKLAQFSAAGSRLTRCRFDRVKIESGSFGAGRETSEYIECSFDGARIRFGPGGYARFVRCSFRDVDLRNWFCFTVELIDCVFSGRLRGAFFNGTVPKEDREVVGRERNEFRGNDFSAMALLDVGFRTGIDLTRQRLPSGPDYLYAPDAAEAVHRARASVMRWTDLEMRQAAMVLVNLLQRDVAAGQQQLLLRRDTFASLRGDAVNAVFDLLKTDG